MAAYGVRLIQSYHEVLSSKTSVIREYFPNTENFKQYSTLLKSYKKLHGWLDPFYLEKNQSTY